MSGLTVTAKGQITLRKDLLQHLGVTTGQKIEVQKLPGGKLALVSHTHDGDIGDFFGCLSGKTKRVATIDDMNEAIAKGWAGQ